MEINSSVRQLWDCYYPNFTGEEFKDFLLSHLSSEYSILEIGAGSGRGDQQNFRLKGTVKRYVGVDLDPRVQNHPDLDEAHVTDGKSLPFNDSTFDVVFHTMVAEHVEHPEIFMSECKRVLKPGGTILFQTPNRFYYPMIVAAITPHWFHEYYIRKFASGRSSKDVFPTFYRLNTKSTITKLCARHNLTVQIQMLSGPPGYLRFNKYFFLLGIAFERIIERNLPFLRGTILIKAKK